MKLSFLSRPLLGVVLGFAALSAHAQTDVDVKALAETWAAAYNLHDRVALGNIYTENAHLMMHGEPTLVGREAITDFWARDFKGGNPLTVINVTHSIRGVDMILVHGDYQVVDRNNGRTLGFGRFAHIWNQGQDGRWHLDRDLWNQPYEPVQAAPAR